MKFHLPQSVCSFFSQYFWISSFFLFHVIIDYSPVYLMESLPLMMRMMIMLDKDKDGRLFLLSNAAMAALTRLNWKIFLSYE